MELKYFIEKRTENGYGEIGIVLDERIFSIRKEKEKFIFMEECDAYFQNAYTKEDAIDLLQEAIDWIKKQ